MRSGDAGPSLGGGASSSSSSSGAARLPQVPEHASESIDPLEHLGIDPLHNADERTHDGEDPSLLTLGNLWREGF